MSQMGAGTGDQESAVDVFERVAAQERVADNRIDFTRLLYLLYMDLEQQIARADTKAQIILSANALLIAAVANLGFGLEEVSLDSITAGGALAMAAMVLTLAAAIVSVYSALRVAFPRLVSSGRRAPDQDEDISLFYSGHIAQLTDDAYVSRFLDLTLQDVKEQVMRGIHAKAGIVQRKFVDVQRSMIGIMAAVVFWALGQIATDLL